MTWRCVRSPRSPLPRALDLERPTVLALDRTLVASAGRARARSFARSRASSPSSGSAIPARPSPGTAFRVDVLASFVPGGASTGTTLVAFRGAFRHAAALAAVRRARNAAVERTRELAELSAIGVALTTERDLGTLLGLILSHARRVTESDAGSLYLVERDENGAPVRLRFAHSQNHSLPAIPFASYAVPIDSLQPRRLRGRHRRAARDRRRLSAARRRRVPAEPQLRRQVRLSDQVDARAPDEDPSRRDHRRAAAHQPQARPRRASHLRRQGRARGRVVRRAVRRDRDAHSRRRRPSRSRTAACTRTSSGCSRGSSPPRSRRSNRATRRRPDTPAASRR